MCFAASGRASNRRRNSLTDRRTDGASGPDGTLGAATSAYRHALGNDAISLEQITASFERDKRILHVPDKKITICTTKEVLAEEKRMVDLAHKSKGKFRPLYA